MKKIIVLVLTATLILSFAACGESEKGENTTAKSRIADSTTSKTKDTQTTEISTENKSTENSTETPNPTPVKTIPQSKKSIYGQKTGTDKTYTGLEPLKEVTLPVFDPDNVRRLSEKSVSHSYGVSTAGKPHSISVENQKIYEKYGGLCLDTSGEKVIYLTFDCGYENGYTGKILDTLKEKGVPAAFFVTLPYIKSSPEIVTRMINEGHTVGNHSDTHPNFANISRTKMAAEIQTVDNYLRVHFGYSSPFFRFPEGAYSISALDMVQTVGFTPVFWSSAYADWDTSSVKGSQYAFDKVTSRLHPGCVLLLHAVSKDNAEALGNIIDWAENNGYKFVSL